MQARPGTTIRSVADDLGVNHETLRNWIRLDDAQSALSLLRFPELEFR